MSTQLTKMIRTNASPGGLLVASATQSGNFELKPRQLHASDYGAILPTQPTPMLTTPMPTTRVEPFVQRNIILMDTLTKLEEASSTGHYHKCALRNIKGWKKKCITSTQDNEMMIVHLLPGDWGDVTLEMTRRYGHIFACLNMANAYSPGGGYTDGCVAQEENMYRRTDCHFSLDRKDDLDEEYMYLPEKTRLLNAIDDRVYLDSVCPRVCIRGAEDRTASDLGYPLLPEEELFLFFELRSAAVDLRRGAWYNRAETTKRVAAQLDTLIEHGVRHVVFSAFGCGAFLNPGEDVAAVYKEELQKRSSDFDVVAFGIFNAGYGPGNFDPFQRVFGDWAT